MRTWPASSREKTPSRSAPRPTRRSTSSSRRCASGAGPPPEWTADSVLRRQTTIGRRNVARQTGDQAAAEATRPVGRPDLAVTRGPHPVAGAIRGGGARVLEAPVQVRLPEMDRERESFLTVRDRANRQVVAVVELLSPTNKRPGENR